MNPRSTMFALLVAAGLCLLGFARWPSAASGGEAGPTLLISSTIGGASAFLFIVDPATRNLAAYEAIPGEQGGLRLIGARKIEHDLELQKFRDLSAYSAEELGRLKGAADGSKEDKAKESSATDKRGGS